MSVHDALGDRMKQQYEDRTRIFLPRRTYTIVRVDGKAFHSWTRRCREPYDVDFMHCMDETALALVREMQGSEFAYVQSDEISVLLCDFDKPLTAAYFDGNLQKIASVSASVATARFNETAALRFGACSPAHFDSRVFTIPDYIEVENYFVWRQQDAERNSVQMLAQHYASAKQLHGKAIPQQHDIIVAAGDNWNDHPVGFKRGRAAVYAGMCWEVVEPPVFTRDREWLRRNIPRHWSEEVTTPAQ